MHRFYLPAIPESGPIVLPDDEARHAAQVLRVRTGERVLLLDGAGGEATCSVVSAERRRVELRLEELFVASFPAPEITLVQAVTKGKSMDLILQKATELGCARIVPLLVDRCVPQIEQEESADKVAKWRLTCVEALKQCGSRWLPKVEQPVTVKEALRLTQRVDVALVGALTGEQELPRAVLQQRGKELGKTPRTVSAWVGPEGDFTPAELEQLTATGVRPVTLGPRVLRSETAALYLLSILQYELAAY